MGSDLTPAEDNSLAAIVKRLTPRPEGAFYYITSKQPRGHRAVYTARRLENPRAKLPLAQDDMRSLWSAADAWMCSHGMSKVQSEITRIYVLSAERVLIAARGLLKQDPSLTELLESAHLKGSAFLLNQRPLTAHLRSPGVLQTIRSVNDWNAILKALTPPKDTLFVAERNPSTRGIGPGPLGITAVGAKEAPEPFPAHVLECLWAAAHLVEERFGGRNPMPVRRLDRIVVDFEGHVLLTFAYEVEPPELDKMLENLKEWLVHHPENTGTEGGEL